MSGSETPFDNIEGSHEYVSLLAEAIAFAVSSLPPGGAAPATPGGGA